MGRNALETLRARGFVEWCSDEAELGARFAGEMVTAYVGFDPSADSLHVGNMVPVMGLAWLQRLGHRPIALTGGGTGLIGDPSGKSKERQLLSVEQMEHNGACVSRQLAQFLDFDRSPNGAIALNNYDWLKQLGFIEFLRDTGKYFTVNYMIAKEFVRSRIEDPEKSISFTEMSYMLLQAYDFAHLFRSTGCRLQMGGNDQQGNITAGIDLIRKTEGESAYGLTFPLLLTASGQKFGKSEQGAVYLSPERTSPYRFHQFWINA
jgi:tyrosyl-tRNA synthetase